MNRMSRIVSFGALAVASLGLISHEAQGVLLAYEGFNPAPSTVNIVGTSTGTGFTGAWVDSVGPGNVNRTADNNNMTSFPSNVPFATPTGGKAQHSNNNYTDQTVTRTLATPLSLDANGRFYMSFLFNDYASNTASVDRQANVFLGNASQRLHVGPSYFDRLSIANVNATAEPFTAAGANRADSAANFFGFNGTSLLFVVAEFNTQSVGNDTINLKGYTFTPGTGIVEADPSLVTWDASLSFNGTGTLNQLGMYFEGPGFSEIDEIRLGTSWLDVTGLAIPEPTTIALALMASGSLLLRRRRA